MVRKKNKKFLLKKFKNILVSVLLNFFSIHNKKGKVEFLFLNVIKKMKKNTKQKPFFFIWSRLKKLFISFKLFEIVGKNRNKNFYIKKLILTRKLKNSVDTLVNKREINLFYNRLCNLDSREKIIKLKKIEQNKFNIRRYVK